MLKAKKNLQAKTTLKASSKLKASKLKKTPQHPKSKLIAKADKLMSRVVRLRDSEWIDGSRVGACITCERVCVVINSLGKWQKSNGWGHFIGRGDFNLRYDPENVSLQCSHCNAWRDKNSMLNAYKLALDDKYGDGTAKKLEHEHNHNSRDSLSREELNQVIEDCLEELKFYESENVAKLNPLA